MISFRPTFVLNKSYKSPLNIVQNVVIYLIYYLMNQPGKLRRLFNLSIIEQCVAYFNVFKIYIFGRK